MRTRGISVLLAVLLLCVFAALIAPRVAEYRSRRAIDSFKASIVKEPIFVKQIKMYRAFMKAVGPERAQIAFAEVMPNDSVTHMLNHELGRYLYETEGFPGIKKCTTAIADSCYHGFISGLVLNEGLGNLPAFRSACTKGTSYDQESQCAHGIGHGFLENVGYRDLPKALDLCQETFVDRTKDTEHCYEGVFMENNFGVFDVAPADRWVKTNDPMYPCNEAFVLKKPGAHEYCWFMQSQSTLRKVQYKELGDVQKVASYCGRFPNGVDKDICFMGLARQIQLKNDNDKNIIRAQCVLLPATRRAQCVWDAAQAAYIYGERGAEIFSTCDVAENVGEKDNCYHTLYGAIGISYSDDRDRLAACDTIPDAGFRDSCKAWVKSPAADVF